MNCPACRNYANGLFLKNGLTYYQCLMCNTVFTDPLDNSGKVGGGFEEERNQNENSIRLERFSDLLFGLNAKETGRILDFGCGHGMLVRYLLESGLDADGYDKFNPDFDSFEPGKKYDIVSMVEVIEHLSHPFEELDTIRELLTKDGVLYIETSFVDVANQENIPLHEFFYIDPSVGHSTIFSHLGLDILMLRKGFRPLNHINRNARLYQKQLA